jgi:hypothetical protein
VDFIRSVVESEASFSEGRERVLEVFTQAFVERALSLHGGNVTRAAAASGLARRYFQTLRARIRAEGE